MDISESPASVNLSIPSAHAPIGEGTHSLTTKDDLPPHVQWPTCQIMRLMNQDQLLLVPFNLARTTEDTLNTPTKKIQYPQWPQGGASWSYPHRETLQKYTWCWVPHVPQAGVWHSKCCNHCQLIKNECTPGFIRLLQPTESMIIKDNDK